MDEKILCVDDELNILMALQRQLRKQFHIDCALGADKALATIARDGPYAAVVSDLQMPGMNGLEFLSELKKSSPETVRIMLTGRADVEAAIAAVNQGSIFRFLTKPCSAEDLARTLEAAMEQYRLVTAERDLLEKTLHGSVKVLTEVLSLVHPAAFSRASRIHRYVRHITLEMKLPNAWQFEVAAMLSQIGCITLEPEALDRLYAGEELSDEEQEMFSAHPAVGRDLLANVPRLGPVAQMIAHQTVGYAEQLKVTRPVNHGDAIVKGAQMLHAAIDLDRLVTRGRSHEEALAKMRLETSEYWPASLDALATFKLTEGEADIRIVKAAELFSTMIVDQDVRARNGLLLLSKGQEVTPSVLGRLKAFALKIGITEPIRVLVPRAEQKPLPTSAS